MLDLIRSRCGKTYHADEDKIGMSILCAMPFCSGLIPVAPAGELKLRRINLAWIAFAVLGGVVALLVALVFQDLRHLGIVQAPIAAVVPRASSSTSGKYTGPERMAIQKAITSPSKIIVPGTAHQPAPNDINVQQGKLIPARRREAAASEVTTVCRSPTFSPYSRSAPCQRHRAAASRRLRLLCPCSLERTLLLLMVTQDWVI